jgi:hypothetical protein
MPAFVGTVKRTPRWPGRRRGHRSAHSRTCKVRFEIDAPRMCMYVQNVVTDVSEWVVFGSRIAEGRLCLCDLRTGESVGIKDAPHACLRKVLRMLKEYGMQVQALRTRRLCESEPSEADVPVDTGLTARARVLY